MHTVTCYQKYTALALHGVHQGNKTILCPFCLRQNAWFSSLMRSPCPHLHASYTTDMRLKLHWNKTVVKSILTFSVWCCLCCFKLLFQDFITFPFLLSFPSPFPFSFLFPFSSIHYFFGLTPFLYFFLKRNSTTGLT